MFAWFLPGTVVVDSFGGLVKISSAGQFLRTGVPIHSLEVTMNNQDAFDVQLCLFATTLAWHEFPQDVRRQVSQLLAIMFLEIVEERPNSEEEMCDES